MSGGTVRLATATPEMFAQSLVVPNEAWANLPTHAGSHNPTKHQTLLGQARHFTGRTYPTASFGRSIMTYRSFLRRFLPRKKAARFSGRKSQRQKRTLHLETLEDRLAPAVLIPVTTHRDLV